MRGLRLLSVMRKRGNGAAGRARGFPVSGRCAIARARLRRHAQRGVTALEFALVAPAALLVLFFSIEIGIMMMADATLTRVTGQIAREMQVDRGTSKNCTAAGIKSLLHNGMGVWAAENHLIVERVEVYPSYKPPHAPSDTIEAGFPCANENPGDLIIYKVGFERSGFTGILGVLGIQLMTFERHFLIQNEP